MMRAILEDLRTGQVTSYSIPEPELRSGGILVQTAFSAISAGTERAKLEQGEKSLIGKAMARPDLVRQVLDFARTDGVRAAYERVQNRLNTLTPLGYSCAGMVLEVGQGVQGFQPGDRVACAGGGYANHSELNFIPSNLAVRVPDAVSLDAAALTTIGSIAVQGLRQSGAVFGETVAVIGAGLVGVLTVQLAKAAGCRVIAIDLDERRVERAKSLGADLGLSSADGDTPRLVEEYSQYGADVVVITAATPSTDPIELAARIARHCGRIVIVGDVGMGVSRQHMYMKELSITMSRSYGPGRYDPQYEEGGIDYPVGHVRWTERRNMEAFLSLLASGAINVAPLIECRYPVENGAEAYAALKATGAYTVLIEYPAVGKKANEGVIASHHLGKAPGRNGLRVGCIGAGSFARNIIFPALRNQVGVTLQSVATSSGVAALSAQQSFGFSQTQTPNSLAQDPDNDALFVLSQHDSHARYVISALSNRKAVFVEKPLAISPGELIDIHSAYDSEKERGYEPFVMVGFNRRFAPLSDKLREFFGGRQEPLVVNCRVNAGFIPRDHWIQRQGGRVVGEMCHYIDWARSVVGSPIETVYAKAIPDRTRYSRDNVVAIITFHDGSVANLTYLANGDKSISKEFFEVFCSGAVAVLDDFDELRLTRHGKTKHIKGKRDKGHRREIQLTVEAILSGRGSPIPFIELMEVTQASFAVLESIESSRPVSLRVTERVSAQEPYFTDVKTVNEN
jgi:predicted dehydrogenase/threonine dehydrogenase-like Zn-dependent dehydrogenase